MRQAIVRAAELNRAGVAVARAAASSVGRSVLVAGSIGPICALMAPLGTMDPKAAFGRVLLDASP